MWYGGTLTMAASSSPAPANSTELTMYDARFRCRSTAAFGSPVVPLVKRSTAMRRGRSPSRRSPSIASSATAARNASALETSMPSMPVEPLGDAVAGDDRSPARCARRSPAAGRRPGGS